MRGSSQPYRMSAIRLNTITRREDKGDGHDDGGVVREVALISSDPMPGAEDLLGDDGAAEDRGELQRDERDHRSARCARRASDDGALFETFDRAVARSRA